MDEVRERERGGGGRGQMKSEREGGGGQGADEVEARGGGGREDGRERMGESEWDEGR